MAVIQPHIGRFSITGSISSLRDSFLVVLSFVIGRELTLARPPELFPRKDFEICLAFIFIFVRRGKWIEEACLVNEGGKDVILRSYFQHLDCFLLFRLDNI